MTIEKTDREALAALSLAYASTLESLDAAYEGRVKGQAFLDLFVTVDTKLRSLAEAMRPLAASMPDEPIATHALEAIDARESMVTGDIEPALFDGEVEKCVRETSAVRVLRALILRAPS